jgi:hypothetical protein
MNGSDEKASAGSARPAASSTVKTEGQVSPEPLAVKKINYSGENYNA